MEFKEPEWVRFTYSSSRGITKVLIRFSGCAGGYVGQMGHDTSRIFYFILWKRKQKSIGNWFFVHHRIVSAVKRVEFVCSRVSYIVLRGC